MSFDSDILGCGLISFRSIDPVTPDFPADQRTMIENAMRLAYDKPCEDLGIPVLSLFKEMIDNWVNSGRSIIFSYESGGLGAWAGTGEVIFDAEKLVNAIYIDNNGKAVEDTVLSALVHELTHALTGKADDGVGSKFWNRATYPDDDTSPNNYKGANVVEANKIFKQLGLPEQNSYIAYGRIPHLTLNKEYTNGAEIDRSIVIGSTHNREQNWNTSHFSNSRDLLIGDNRDNVLASGDENDFLHGLGGEDHLHGGDGKDFIDGGTHRDFIYGDGNDRDSGINEA